MKIELNPSRMTVAELTDCIAELSAQRDRLLEEGRCVAEAECHDAFIEALGTVWGYTEEGKYDVFLHIKSNPGRTHVIKLNMENIECWHIEVSKKVEQ